MQTKSLRALLLGATALSLAVLAPSQARAQLQVQVDYNSDLSQLGAGLGYNFGLGSMTKNNDITAVATFDYYLSKNYGTFGADLKRTYWEANVNGKMDIKSVKGLYVGAGLGIGEAGWSCSTAFGFCGDYASASEFHLDVLGGYNFGSKKKGPFVEAGFNIGGSGNGGGLRLTGGVRF